MNSERDTPGVPPGSADGRGKGSALRQPSALLHGRLLDVSRLATIGEMAAGIAHELNQPLTAIANYAHACDRLLMRSGADPGEVREALQEIAAQTARAADIVHRLRALARSQQPEHTPLSVNALLAELDDLLQSDALLHGVALSVQLAPGLPEVLADGGQIQQVVLNLVRNSLEALAGHRAPRIVIRTAASAAGEVELSVTDNGPGVPPESMKRIFDPFFSTKDNGTGLGLAISSTIARAHGGRVGYRPAAPNGACFYIILPTQPPD